MKDELTKKTGLTKRQRVERAKKAHAAWLLKYPLKKRKVWAKKGAEASLISRGK